MDSNAITFDYKKRHDLSKWEKNYGYGYTLLMFALGIILIIRGQVNLGICILMIVLGIIKLLLILWGKELGFTRHYLKATENKLIIKNNPNQKDVVDLKSVENISILSSGLKISFGESVKFINLDWLTTDQFHLLQNKLIEVSKLNNFKIY
jgi:Na+/melibiose symporter-like transporter